MRTHLSHGSSGGGDMLLGEPKRACHRERATESVPPRAECAALRSGSRLRVVQRRRDRTTGAGSARRVHTRRVARARTARACSAKQRPPAQTAAQRSPCRLVTPAARAAQRECRLTSGRRTMLGCQAHRRREQPRATHHVEPRRRFLPWPPRLVSATRRGAAEAEACAGRARDQPAAWEGSHEAASPRRSEPSAQEAIRGVLDISERVGTRVS